MNTSMLYVNVWDPGWSLSRHCKCKIPTVPWRDSSLHFPCCCLPHHAY